MNVPAAATRQGALSERQIALIKNTVAKDCNNDEFNLFVEVARSKGLDPFLGQIIPMVFSKDDPEKRKLTIIVSRDGQRVIAQRCGDYRPASKPAVYDIDPALESPANPLGIVSATTYLWKQDPKTADWYEVAGQAFWEEFAPLKTDATGGFEWVETGEVWPDSGKPKKRKKLIGETFRKLDDSGNWARMPRLMIAKCAEMQALRAGWPEQFTGLYDEAEMDRAKALDADAAEIAENFRAQQRLAIVNAQGTIPVTFEAGGNIEYVPVGQAADRIIEWIEKHCEGLADLMAFEARNQNPLKELWAHSKADGLEIRKKIDAAKARLEHEDATQ